jgi:RNA polymerase sigma factor for flagellar operon FliA
MESRRAELIEDHVGLVDHVVSLVALGLPSHVDRSELLAAGRLGLVEAAERDDFDQPVPFAAFAAPRVRGAALDAVRGADWTPRRTRALARRVEQTRRDLQSSEGGHPSDDAVAEQLELPAGALRRLRDQLAQGRVARLDATPGSGRPTAEVLDDPFAVDAEQMLVDRESRQELRSAVAALSERHRLVVTALYLDGRTTEDVAALLGVSRSRVSQLRSDALGRLRELLAEGRPAPSPAAAPSR